MSTLHKPSLLVALALATTLTGAARAEPVPAAPSPQPWRWGGFVEDDLGVLLMSGGVGLFAGPTYGPLRAGAGFYRFDSPFRALSGAPEGFELKVDAILAGDLTWHFASDRIEGPYVKAVVQAKSQRVENLESGARRSLSSFLVGPEIGWTIRVRGGLYLAPRLGALYYAVRPQGPDNRPVEIGGKPYDNDHHKTFDLYATLGIGYAF
ncbi:MAG: hypothetical protein HYV09_13345 [Deltaproteobacteria bacterium]|nr:hypothetical protein [Deltaproteobacteria bacterium]